MTHGKRFDSELNVRSESIQRIYSNYLAGRFVVNRRYQRKLVWSVDEKKRLIDSAIQQLPIPLILVAEKPTETAVTQFEVIDGMQRLNAIIAFIENEYAIGPGYFDLSTLADTKARFDQGRLVQRQPVISREESTDLANYTLALSVFRSSSEDSVDEVFRRINSSGRKLSTQDLRQAGTTSRLADLVRSISAQVRGDSSPTDQVPLSAMPNLSISSANLDYGINVDEIYWVKDGILNREDVRMSLDEELVLDVVIDMLVDPIPNTGTKNRDLYFNFTRSLDEGHPTQQSRTIEAAIASRGEGLVSDRFFYVKDELRRVVEASGTRFCDLIGIGSRNSIPRYFHCAFLALFQLLVDEDFEIHDYADAAARLRGKHQQFHIAKGGEWTESAKRGSIDVVKSFLRPSMQARTTGRSPLVGRASVIERILANSYVENQLFEIKQGFISLDSPTTVSSSMIKKVARTISAMANQGPGCTGYLLVGVADNDADAQRLAEFDGIVPVRYRDFSIVGIEREARRIGASIADYWDQIVRKVGTCPGLDPSLAQRVMSSVTLVPYSGLVVGVFEVKSAAAPVFFDAQLVERRGSETVTVSQSEYANVYARFLAS